MILRANIHVNGIVQGVGFRPFIHKHITTYNLRGWVRNTSDGAEIEVEGPETDIDSFVFEIEHNPPELALISSVEVSKSETLKNYSDFQIITSKKTDEIKTLISPDVCVCEDCLSELYTEGARYRYPFINCTNCGPRFTIIKDIPYDRKNTSMAGFKMCESCNDEYTDIDNRRYHAEPTGCNACGPKQYFVNEAYDPLSGDPIANARKYLREDKILAIKGLGGFHLACKFDNPDTVKKLRERKQRDEKPFAIMCKDIDEVKKYCFVSAAEEKILSNNRRPIVLLRKKEGVNLDAVSENGFVGVMLPYTPVHFMLFEEDITALIFTSANLSDTPIIYKDTEALEKLAGIADGYLLNNREIVTRCDDSLCYVFDGKEYLVRRSRGYVPYPILMNRKMPHILACGAEQKASFCLSKGKYVIPSQHIGDMKNIETFENYTEQIKHFEKLFDIEPEIIACDMHPDFMSSIYANERAEKENLSFIRIQHHHAHMASCMADNGLEGDVIGLTWDGTGYGEDGAIWGGEFLVGGYQSYKRVGHLRYMTLPGGDKATKELWRTGISLLIDSAVDPSKCFGAEHIELVKRQIKLGVNVPKSSSMGRLFDGVSAILGIKVDASYEGQGAILLEAAAGSFDKTYEYGIIREAEKFVLDYRPMIREIVADIEAGVPTSEIASAFMNTLIEAAAKMCNLISMNYGVDRVVMSGGTFNNMYIMNRLPMKLIEKHLKPYHHHRVSCGDEGISLGQLIITSQFV